MLKLLAIFIILAGFVKVKTEQLCRDELQSWSLENRVCYERAVGFNNLTAQLADGVITFDELAAKIAVECEAANSTSCYRTVSLPIRGPCNEAAFVQHFRNALKTVIIFNEYMCQNNGQTYLDFVKNGGSQCYFNEERKRCFQKSKSKIDLHSDPEFSDRYICPHLNAELTCIHHYNNCENQNVGNFYRKIVMLAREKFSC